MIIGSRDAGARPPLRPASAATLISGTVNADAAAQADVVIAAIPWDGHKDLLTALAPQLAGKIVIDCVNPMGFDGKGAYALPVPEGSAASRRLRSCPTAPSWAHSTTCPPNCCWLPRSACSTWTCWCSVTTGRPPTWCRRWPAAFPAIRGIYGGRLRNCGQIEALTANLVSINRRYKAHAGIRVTDL